MIGRYRLISVGFLLCCLALALWASFNNNFVHVSAQSAAAPAQSASAVASEMKPYAETIPGTEVKFEMIPIPGGAFQMGSPQTEANRGADEGPPHEVTIRPFWMGKTEVTWNEYDIFAFKQNIKKSQTTPSAGKGQPVDALTQPTPPYADETFGLGREGQPVISITHHAAMEYCRWLSAKTGKTYRLPTEAEWEYAARAGTKTAYSFGDEPAKLGEHGWFLDNADGKPQKVALKKPNAFGLYDMHGNVAEWVLDYYSKDFYGKAAAGAVNPFLPPTEKRYPDVVRGGSWDDEAPILRSAARRASSHQWSKRDPQQPQSIWWHTEAIMVGFRIVRPLEGQDNLKGLRSKVTKESPNY